MCKLCEGRIKKLSVDAVICSNKICLVRLCYACFGKCFIRLLSLNPEFLQIYGFKCEYCWIKDSIVVCEFGDHGVTRDFQQDAFCCALLDKIKVGVNECEQLLGKVTTRLAGFCHDLNEVLDSVTEKPFKRVENTVLSLFMTFVLQYNGPNIV